MVFKIFMIFREWINKVIHVIIRINKIQKQTTLTLILINLRDKSDQVQPAGRSLAPIKLNWSVLLGGLVGESYFGKILYLRRSLCIKLKFYFWRFKKKKKKKRFKKGVANRWFHSHPFYIYLPGFFKGWVVHKIFSMNVYLRLWNIFMSIVKNFPVFKKIWR